MQTGEISSVLVFRFINSFLISIRIKQSVNTSQIGPKQYH